MFCPVLNTESWERKNNSFYLLGPQLSEQNAQINKQLQYWVLSNRCLYVVVYSASLKGQFIFLPYYTHTHTQVLGLITFGTFPAFLQQEVVCKPIKQHLNTSCFVISYNCFFYTASPHPSKIQISIKFFTLPSTFIEHRRSTWDPHPANLFSVIAASGLYRALTSPPPRKPSWNSLSR